MKKSAIIVSFMLATGMIVADSSVSFAAQDIELSVLDDAMFQIAAVDRVEAREAARSADRQEDRRAARAEARKNTRAEDLDEEESLTASAEVTPVEVVSFRTEKGEKVTVVTFSDASVVVTVDDNPPLTGSDAMNAIASAGISVGVSDTGAITSVQTVPTVEIVQAPVAADAVVDATVAATVVAATEAAKTEVAKAETATGDTATEGSEEAEQELSEEMAEGDAEVGEPAEATDSTDEAEASEGTESSGASGEAAAATGEVAAEGTDAPESSSTDSTATDTTTSSDTISDTTTSTTPAAPPLGANTGAGSSAGDSFQADEPSKEIPKDTDVSPTVK